MNIDAMIAESEAALKTLNYQEPAPAAPSRLRRAIADPALSVLKGAIAVPEAALGIADIVTGGRAGKLAEKAGFKPKEAKSIIDTYYTPEQQQLNREVANTEGFFPTIAAAIQRPSTIAHSVLESAPGMIGAGGVARGIMKAAPKAITAAAGEFAPTVAAAVGEGVFGAGSAAEQIRQETPTGTLTPKQAAIAAASGVGTAAFGLAGGGLARKMGIADVDTMVAGGKLTGQSKVGMVKGIAGGMLAEGVLEELPQSAQEQVMQNLALGKPWDERVAESAALGGLAGAAMGGGGQVLSQAGDYLEQRGQQPNQAAETIAPPVAPSATDPLAPGGNIAGTSLLQDSTPQPLPAALPSGPMSKALAAGGISTLPVSATPVSADMYSAFAANPFANAPVSQPAAPVPATPDPAQIELGQARAWANQQIQAGGNGHLMQGNRMSDTSYGDYLVSEYRKAREKADGITNILPELQNQGAGQVDGQRVAMPVMQKEVAGVGSNHIQPGGIANDLSNVQEEVSGQKEKMPDLRNAPVNPRIAELQQEKDTLLANPRNRGIAGTVYSAETTRRVNEINAEIQKAGIDAVAHTAATSPHNDIPQPTQAQIEAGNYKKGHINIHGLDIAIENPAGSVRKGVDETGKAWETKIAHHYGYIKGTIGKDKDHVDTFIGPQPESRKVFVIDQINPKTGALDEHKVMIGFTALASAREGYLANYDKSGPARIGAVTESTVDAFKQWLKDGDTRKAFAGYDVNAPVIVKSVRQNQPSPRRQLDTSKDSLIVAIAKLGGIDRTEVDSLAGNGKELARTLNLAAGKEAGTFLHVISTKGQPLDKMREALVENGYLNESDDINTLLNKLDSASRGQVHRSTHSADAGADAYREAEIQYSEMINAMTDEEYEEFSRNQWLDEQVVELAEASGIIDEYLAQFAGEDMTAADWQEVENDLKEALDAEFTEGSVEEDQGPLQEDAEGEAESVHAVGEGDTKGEGKANAGEAVERPSLQNATAPEHVETGVNDKEMGQIVAEFNSVQQSMADGDEQVHHLFDAPKKAEIFRLQDKVKIYNAKQGWMTVAEAKTKIQEWKDHAKAQGKTNANSERIVLSLFDLSGEWSKPWEEAGYQVYRFDIQADPEVGDVHKFSVEHFMDNFASFEGQDIYAILAATPCTDFAVSGARHFAAKDADGRTISSVKLVHQTLATIEYFKPAVWSLENPVGRIEKLGGLPPWRMSFDPNHVGDPYTKKTLLWGRFNGDLPVAPVDPVDGSKMHKLYGGKSQATKNARSVTPEGFSYSFFMANNAVDHPVMAVANKFDRLDKDLMAKAVETGLSEEEITGIVEDFYYQELDDTGAEEALKEAIREKAPAVLKATAQLAAPATVATSTLPEKTKLEDFGEKIGGARKDYAAKFDHAKTLDIATEPFAKTWPEPDYLKLLADGFDEQHVSLVRALRDEIPDKPRKSWKLKPWVELVTSLRDHAEKTLQGNSPVLYKVLKDTEFSNSAAQNIAGRAELYHAVGHGVSLRGVTLSRHYWSLYRGEKDVTKWHVERPQKATAFGNMPRELGLGNTKAEAIADFKEKLGTLDQAATDKKKTQFIIYQYRAKDKPGHYIGKKVDTDYLDLQKFDDPKTAREYLSSHQAELEAQLASMKNVPNERRSANNPRTGKDYRGGKDVTPEMFTQSFGFRGVEFGNYVEGTKRQIDLNNAFDALNDLAGLLNIPTQAISLNGELGLAFGARGHGGKNAAAAHYESGKVVINLTKNQGAGSLAHEWFHGFDSYLSRKRGYKSDFITDKTVKYGPADETRQELIDAFKELKKTLDATNLKSRSRELDKTRSKDYWSTGIEMHARAFENYVIDKLTDNNSSNDYLANINSISEYADAMLQGFMSGKTANDLYPYLLDSEKAVVVTSFDNLFTTLKTKQTDKGIALYSNPMFDPRAIVASLSGLKENLQQDLPKLVNLGQRVIHEGAGKYQEFVAGIKKYLGVKWATFKNVMIKVYQQAKAAYAKSSAVDKEANFALAGNDNSAIVEKKGADDGTDQGEFYVPRRISEARPGSPAERNLADAEGVARAVQSTVRAVEGAEYPEPGLTELKGAQKEFYAHLKSLETAALLHHMEEKGVFPSAGFIAAWQRGGKQGETEHKVAVAPDGKTVRKFGTAAVNHTWTDYLQRIVLHNSLFPGTSYEYKGLSTIAGQLHAVVDQVYITGENIVQAVQADIDSAMKKLGFESFIRPQYAGKPTEVTSMARLWVRRSDKIAVWDIRPANVLQNTETKTLYFIDPVVEQLVPDYNIGKLPSLDIRDDGRVIGSRFEYADGEVVPRNDANFALSSPFYSHLQQVVEKKMGGRMPVADLLKMLKANGVTDAEIDNVIGGIRDEGGIATRQQVLDEIKVNSTEFEDVVLGANIAGWDKLESDLHKNEEARLSNGYTVAKESGVYEIYDDGGGFQGTAGNTVGEALTYLKKTYPDYASDTPTHFSQYTEPGAKEGSYREMFVTTPEVPTSKPYEQWLSENWTGEDNDHSRELYTIQQDPDKNWQDGHSEYSAIQNPIVRIRFNEREADGKRILFFEEMQGPSDSNQQKMPEYLRKRIYDIGVKRVLAYASENGFDGVAWTTGEMQAKRYDLSKQISKVVYERASGGVSKIYQEEDYHDRGTLLAWDTEGKQVIKESLDDSQLPEYIGKDLAKKLLEVKPELADRVTGGFGGNKRSLSGLDLKVGGEGLSSLYDKTLPGLFKKYGKEGIETASIGTATARPTIKAGFASRVDAEEWLDAAGDEDFIVRLNRETGNYDVIDKTAQDSSISVPYIPLTDKTPAVYAQFKQDAARVSGLKATEAQAWVKTLPIAKRVNVVQSVDDLPENARNEITKARVNPAHVQAMELHGTIHVIADNVPDLQRVKALVIGHELAHAGQTKKVVDWAVDWFKRTKDSKSDQAREAHFMLQRIADRYGYDLADEKQFRRAVQEATAAIAEQAATEGWKPAGLMQRLFMYIKHWLRQNGLISHVSDVELSLAVAEMLRLGEKRLSVGKGDSDAQFAMTDDNDEASFSLADQAISIHTATINAPAKVTDMVKSLMELAGQSLPPRLKANIGKILSNPWFGSEGNQIRRHVVNLNLERSQNRNSIISDLFQKSEGYTGVEGLDNILKKASKEELKLFNDLIKHGDENGVAQTFTRDELFRGKTKFGKVGKTVVDAYKAFIEVMQAANRVRFEQLDQLSMLPYKDQEWYADLVELLNKNQQRMAGLSGIEAGEFHRLVRSLKRGLTDEQLASGENPAKIKASPGVIAAYRDFWRQVDQTEKKLQGNMLSAFRDILGYRGELDKLKNEWGSLRGYAPRNRKDGDYHVSVYRTNDDGERVKVYMKPTLTETGAKSLVKEVQADLKKHLKGNFEEGTQYEVEYERNSATPSELLAWKGSEVAVEALLNQAFDRAGVTGKMSVEEWQSLKHEVFQQISKEIMAQGFGRHGISREATLIEGYDDTDYQTVLKEYISGMSGWLSKMRFAIETTSAAKDLSKADPSDKVWVNDYVQDAMKNSTYLDELAATARSVGAVYYLGFKVSSAVLNAFQNYTVGQAELSLMMKKAGQKGSAVAALAGAQKDVMKDWLDRKRGGKGTLTEEEHDVLFRAVREGTAQAQAIRQISGTQEMGFGTGWKKFTELSMTPFQFVEQMLNREPGILAAYRTFKKTAAGTFDAAAYKQAEVFVNNTHYVMGKENLPEMVRKLGPLGKTVYLFQGYVHNYMHWMYNRGKDGEFATIARSLGAIAALGGVFALPGADDLDKWIMKWFGVSYKMKFKKFVRDNAGNSTPGQMVQNFVNHGVTSVAGVDMSRALAVNIPFISDPDKTVGDRMGGAWGGLLKKPGMAVGAAQKGDYLRAVENLMPEFAANPMRALRQYNQGATTMSGKPIFDENGRPVKYSSTDVGKKMLGFNPLEVSERTEMKGDERELNAFWKGERDDALANVRRAKTTDELKAAVRGVVKYNTDLRKSQAFGLVPIIKADSIQKSRTFKPQKKTMAWERNQLD